MFSFLKYFSSTDGIFIFSLITLIFKASFSQALSISKSTLVQAGHFIFATASNKLKSFNSSQLAFIIISFFNKPNFSAGDHFKTLSIFIQKSNLSTTAHIHSKSHVNIFSNSSLSFFEKNSVCLSHKESTNHFVAQFIRSSFFIQSKS